MEINSKYRFEKKFLIPKNYQNKILDMILTNPYRFKKNHPKRRINNIYFDDINLSFANQNFSGNAIRTKYRLRWYGDKYCTKNIILEKKFKRGETGNKYFYKINNFNFNENSNLATISSELKNKSQNIFIKEFIKYYYPTLLNSYLRMYFISYDKKIRITIDSKIENYRINAISHFQIPFYEKNTKMIMEMKYDNDYLNNVSLISQYFPFRVQKNSKYINGVLEVNS